jgi:hypothetical protein
MSLSYYVVTNKFTLKKSEASFAFDLETVLYKIFKDRLVLFKSLCVSIYFMTCSGDIKEIPDMLSCHLRKTQKCSALLAYPVVLSAASAQYLLTSSLSLHQLQRILMPGEPEHRSPRYSYSWQTSTSNTQIET